MAIGSGHKYIALSNESSANEATVSGTQINHQYSKSFDFEDDFRTYSKASMHSDLPTSAYCAHSTNYKIAGLSANKSSILHILKVAMWAVKRIRGAVVALNACLPGSCLRRT